MHAKYVVDLTPEEREQLLQLTRRGKTAVRRVARARILLKADKGLTDEQIVQAVDTSLSTVTRVRQRFVEEGLEQALRERPRPGQRPKLDGRHQAHLIAVACSPAPEGHVRWTLRLLADKAVELGFVETISRETVRRTLKKTRLSPGGIGSGASLPSARSS
ncbi:MAG: helix-turn-helix domain-containing protein [Elusimicrobia bacterium]|nr:helix-turn-helix domain-containing protein [Elusimicrobiota bacterium]